MVEKLTLRDAVRYFGINCDTSRRTVNIECPRCGKGPRDRKLNINFDRYGPDDGGFRCVRCDVSGRALHFWALMRGLDVYDMAAASADYRQAMGQDQKVGKKPVKKAQQVKYERIDVDPADVETRHRTYTALLSSLSLRDNHHQELLGKRGLSEAVIQRNMYKSYPVTSHTSIAQLLLSQGYVLEGVPGFYQDKKTGQWTMLRFPSGGYLIPQRDGFGRIQGMQLRLDNPTSAAKYLTISTGENYLKGSKGAACCHLARGKSIKSVILTEGPLKADIISHLTGMSVIAIPGVNALSYLYRALYDLKASGTKKVITAFDMDLYSNPHVADAFEKLKGMLNTFRIPYQQLVWDKDYKGLDDYLLAHRNDKRG